MPSFPDSAVLILLVLLLFGPKKLPELARQFGKLMADFRRASNEFRTQMEDELRLSEQADRQKQIAATEAAAPATPAIEASNDSAQTVDADSAYATKNQPSLDSAFDAESQYPLDPLDSAHQKPLESSDESISDLASESTPESMPETAPVPLPIATSGELSILPPSTGLPIANSAQLPFPEDLPAKSAAQASVPDLEPPAHEPAAHQAEALNG